MMRTAIEPREDLEIYLAYSRPAGAYADFADIRQRLMAVAPTFDFDRAVTSGEMQVLTVRDDQSRVRGMAVMGALHRKFHLYYADDAVTTRNLMGFVDEVMCHGQS